MLEGRDLNLRAREREDIDWLTEYFNNLAFTGEYDPVTPQRSRTERLKDFENPSQLSILTEAARFMIEKKDCTRIGTIAHWLVLPNRWMEIGYHLMPAERGKGYGTEAVQIITDYLFLSKPVERVQAITDTRNKPSQRVLEKAGFKREGTVRKSGYARGAWTNAYLYSILREEWKQPQILAKHV